MLHQIPGAEEGKEAHIVGENGFLQAPDNLGLGQEIADPQSRQAEGLGEGAQDDQVFVAGQEVGQAGAGILGIGFIDHHRAPGPLEDIFGFPGRDAAARGVVGAAEKEEGFWVGPFQDSQELFYVQGKAGRG